MARVMRVRAKDLMAEALLVARSELTRVLREQADAEASGYVAQRLRAVADAFDAGQRPGSIGGNSE